MSNLGIGVMVGDLSGYAGGDHVIECRGKRIVGLSIVDNKLRVSFDDGTLVLYDGGQSCCEHRYMTTDEPLDYYIGATFAGVVTKDGGTRDGCEVHEIEFLYVNTDIGAIDFVNHNEHNGYYGGFSVVAEWEPK